MAQEERIALAIERQKKVKVPRTYPVLSYELKVALMALAEHDKELKEIFVAMAGDLNRIDIRLGEIEEKLNKRKKNKDNQDDAENPLPPNGATSSNQN